MVSTDSVGGRMYLEFSIEGAVTLRAAMVLTKSAGAPARFFLECHEASDRILAAAGKFARERGGDAVLSLRGTWSVPLVAVRVPEHLADTVASTTETTRALFLSVVAALQQTP